MPFLTIFGAALSRPLIPDPWWTYDGTNFRKKRRREKIIATVDFSDLLAQGEFVKSATWESHDSSGAEISPSMIIGRSTISGPLVSQMIVGGIPGVTCYPICFATTSQGQILTLPRPELGVMPVVD